MLLSNNKPNIQDNYLVSEGCKAFLVLLDYIRAAFIASRLDFFNISLQVALTKPFGEKVLSQVLPCDWEQEKSEAGAEPEVACRKRRRSSRKPDIFLTLLPGGERPSLFFLNPLARQHCHHLFSVSVLLKYMVFTQNTRDELRIRFFV